MSSYGLVAHLLLLSTSPHGDVVTVGFRPESVYLERTFTSLNVCARRRTSPAIYHWEDGKNEFLCPCHNSLFAIDGKVISGPAPRPLDRYETKVEGNKLLVGKLIGSPESKA